MEAKIVDDASPDYKMVEACPVAGIKRTLLGCKKKEWLLYLYN